LFLFYAIKALIFSDLAKYYAAFFIVFQQVGLLAKVESKIKNRKSKPVFGRRCIIR
jgi:hypothetical protein